MTFPFISFYYFFIHFQKRVSRQTRDLYFTGIEDTPFTLALSIPTQYGKYRLQTRSEDEIHRENLKGTNIINFFNGSNWKIHPDWWVNEWNMAMKSLSLIKINLQALLQAQ